MAKKAAKSSAEGPSKSGAIKEFLSKGITAPKKIAALAKEQYNLDITPAYASMIKSGMKKKRHLKPRGGALKARAASEATVASSGRSSSSGMEVENAALKLALRAGGIENAIRVLRKLES